MKFNTFLKATGSTVMCLFLFSYVLNGQTYSFRNYSDEYNIPDGFVYTINQANNGYLWVGVSNGIARFDGFEYFPVEYPDSYSVGRTPSVSYKSKNGTIWFGCMDGSVYYTSENRLIALNIKNTSNISQILETKDGSLLIVAQSNSIYKVNQMHPEEIKVYPVTGDILMFTAAITRSGDLLLGSQGSIVKCTVDNDTITVKEKIEGFENSNITSIHSATDSIRYIIGTEDNGLFQLVLNIGKTEPSRFKSHPEWSSLKVKSITRDSENYFWIATTENGVIQFRFTDKEGTIGTVRHYNTGSGLIHNDVRLVYQDSEGNFWFGLDGRGLSMLSSYAFGFYSPSKAGIENNIIYINTLNDKILLGTPSGFHLFDMETGKSVSFTSLSGYVKAPVSSYLLDRDKNLWIGTDGNGLFVRTASGSISLVSKTYDTGSDQINCIAIDDSKIWLGTTNGLIVLDKRSKREIRRFNNSNGLPYNSINKILITSKGKVIIGTQSPTLFQIDNDTIINPASGQMSGNTFNTILSITESRNGKIWAATDGNGIFECSADSVSSISRLNGLFSNFCYSIHADSEGDIWIGHSKGFSRLNPRTGVVAVFGADYTKSGNCNDNAIYESDGNKIFIGTTEGLIVYDRKKDIVSSIPPYTNVNYITVNDSVYPYQPQISLPYKKYRITVNYTGISFRSPDKVWYSTYLENSDPEWTKLSSERKVTYTLDDGKFRFYLTSVNDQSLSQETPVSLEIFIRRPWWRTWWSILSAIAILSSAITIIIRERDKAQKKIQLYLEKELDARTSVVLKQKGEIELQNIEITDSINYAKRIQSSILPDVNKLKESFKDAFILFHPRDIVSGDFYWFDKLKDDKFILVCADSTGHGVPGAFMSMIGSTLLQDIVTRKGISKPSEILTLLDKQIFSTLNQNVELGVSNDGMDMVVCEFDIKTRHVRFASAMRPVIIVMEGEPYYIKGNRSSVGGESVIEKYFDDQEYYLNEGDTIYLFSDGLPDQFGGTDGKKMKIARLKRIIEQVSKLPMDEQKEAMAKYYFDWKGTYDQVDDILLMAVRV